MSTATHYENANFLRELAESLPRIWPNGTPARTELLQRLADEELAQAQHSEWIRAKVAAARADTRPTLTTDEVRASLKARYEGCAMHRVEWSAAAHEDVSALFDYVAEHDSLWDAAKLVSGC